jgi:hypothetical protein
VKVVAGVLQTPSASIAQSDVTNLVSDLAGKAASGHNHDAAYAVLSHTHAIANVTGLQTALDGKQAAGSYAAASHTHTQGDVTNLTTDLAAKAPTARTISTTAPLTGGGDLSINRTFAISSFAGSAAGAVPASAGGTSNFLRADGAWAAPGGGTDPWTYVKLGSDFTTSSATADRASSTTALARCPK